MRLVYPIILIPFDDNSGGYTVEVPDLPGCVTQGDDLADALYMAEDAASGWVLDELEDGKPAPKASRQEDVHSDEPGAQTSLVVLDMDAYADKYGKKAVRRNVSIPAWLGTYADQHKISYSKVLRDGLETQYRKQLQDA